ncbi:hypothetical protein CR513_59354, partial [Mucuna pruriens]
MDAGTYECQRPLIVESCTYLYKHEAGMVENSPYRNELGTEPDLMMCWPILDGFHLDSMGANNKAKKGLFRKKFQVSNLCDVLYISRVVTYEWNPRGCQQALKNVKERKFKDKTIEAKEIDKQEKLKKRKLNSKGFCQDMDGFFFHALLRSLSVACHICIIECFNYDELVKVRMVSYQFSGYGIVWWNQYIREVKDTRFVPASYAMDLYNKLQRMYQGPKSV